MWRIQGKRDLRTPLAIVLLGCVTPGCDCRTNARSESPATSQGPATAAAKGETDDMVSSTGNARGSEYNPLTPEEERVILRKGTERAFTGEYTDLKEAGTFVCRRCNAPLYRS